MVYTSLIAVLFCVTFANAKVLPTPASGRIIGGSDAAEGQFPYQVAIEYHGFNPKWFRCGGSIYNKQWIITGAMCIFGMNPSDYKVVVGSTKLNSGGDTYDVERFVVHENFTVSQDITVSENDIALIKVKGDIKFTDKVQPIPLGSKFVGESERGVVTGWGWTSSPGNNPETLQFIEVTTVTNQECNDEHGMSVADTNMCTFINFGEHMCHEDDGGPLVIDGELAGIAKWMLDCKLMSPDIFVRVFSFKSWIEENAVI